MIFAGTAGESPIPFGLHQYSFSASATVGQPNGGLRTVELTWLVQRDGVTLGSFSYRSAIPDSVSSAWPVFGKAAAESAATRITSLLRSEAKPPLQAKN